MLGVMRETLNRDRFRIAVEERHPGRRRYVDFGACGPDAGNRRNDPFHLGRGVAIGDIGGKFGPSRRDQHSARGTGQALP